MIFFSILLQYGGMDEKRDLEAILLTGPADQAGQAPAGEVCGAPGAQTDLPGNTGEHGVILSAKVQPPAIQKVGNKNLAALYLEATPEEKTKGIKSGILEFSEQEKVVLEAFMSTLDPQKAADAAGVTLGSAKRMMRRPNLKRVINRVREQALINTATTAEWAIGKVRKVADGDLEMTDQSWDAVKTMLKYLKPEPAAAGTQVNIQNNYYTGVKKEAINAEWAARGVNR